jgi:hypothetical protein
MQSVEAKHATTETETTMNARPPLMFGMAALGLALMVPVHAASDVQRDGAFVVARKDGERDAHRATREPRRDGRRTRERDDGAEAGPDNERGYGYGYERRQKKRQDERDRPRDRR